MKAAVLPVLLILAGAFASPPQNAQNRDAVTESIRDIFRRMAQYIRDSGLDPFKIESYGIDYQGNYIQFEVFIEGLSFTGASNIVINNLYNNVLFGTFDFDVVLPGMSLTIDNATLRAPVWQNFISGRLTGSLKIRNIRLAGQVRYSGSIIIGVEIVDITLDNSIGDIEADVSVFANGNDYSERVNIFLNDTLPNILANFRNEINAFLAEVIMRIIRLLTH